MDECQTDASSASSAASSAKKLKSIFDDDDDDEDGDDDDDLFVGVIPKESKVQTSAVKASEVGDFVVV